MKESVAASYNVPINIDREPEHAPKSMSLLDIRAQSPPQSELSELVANPPVQAVLSDKSDKSDKSDNSDQSEAYSSSSDYSSSDDGSASSKEIKVQAAIEDEQNDEEYESSNAESGSNSEYEADEGDGASRNVVIAVGDDDTKQNDDDYVSSDDDGGLSDEKSEPSKESTDEKVEEKAESPNENTDEKAEQKAESADYGTEELTDSAVRADENSEEFQQNEELFGEGAKSMVRAQDIEEYNNLKVENIVKSKLTAGKLKRFLRKKK